MLTPAFELSQDDTSIIIIIKAPFAKISDTEIYADESEFKFYSRPYYLRLNLPGKIVENGAESAKYDVDKGHFTVVMPKATPGEWFEGLDMLTRLLAPACKGSVKGALIEILDSEEAPLESGAGGDEDVVDDADFDWHIEQELPEEGSISLQGPKYGFANQRSGVLKHLQEELHGVIELPDADAVPAARRRQLRIQHEDAHFEDDHYLADLYEDGGVRQVLAYCPHWVAEYNQVHAGAEPGNVVALTDDMKEKMLKLPRKEYLLDKAVQKEMLLGLVDLMFAYAYNHRTTEGDNTVESSWAVTKLSPMLCWLETPTSVKGAVVAGIRRSLCFPIYRSWKLAKRLLKDVQRIFLTGRRSILRCLLELHALLQDTDSRYILNDLYVTDYCVWIQSVRDKYIQSLAKKLSQVTVQKSDIGFDLELLEQAAALAKEEHEQSDTPVDIDLQNLSLRGDEKTATKQVTAQPSDGEESSSEESSSSEYETDSSDDSSSDDSYHSASVTPCSNLGQTDTCVPTGPNDSAQNAPHSRVLIEDITSAVS